MQQQLVSNGVLDLLLSLLTLQRYLWLDTRVDDTHSTGVAWSSEVPYLIRRINTFTKYITVDNATAYEFEGK